MTRGRIRSRSWAAALNAPYNMRRKSPAVPSAISNCDMKMKKTSGISRRGADTALHADTHAIIWPALSATYGTCLPALSPTDLTLYPGFSGGPLLRLDGRALGINTSAYGNSFALPLSILRETVQALQAHKPTPKRAFLGVSGQSVRLPAALTSELGQEAGLLLTSIQSGSAAETAGLLLGDTLLSLDGERVTTLGELHAALTAERIGQSLATHLVRAGGLMEISVQLGERA